MMESFGGFKKKEKKPEPVAMEELADEAPEEGAFAVNPESLKGDLKQMVRELEQLANKEAVQMKGPRDDKEYPQALH